MDVLKVAVFLLYLFEELGTSSSKNYEVPNMALKGFTYWSTTLSNKYQCESLCWKSVSCRSVNFNMRNGTCELNYKENEKKDALTPEEETLYITANDQHDTHPPPCRGRPCEENGLCIVVNAMRYYLCLPIGAAIHTDTNYMCVETPALCYKIVTDTWNWTEARSHCQQDGGDLIILDSDEKMDFIAGVLENRGGYYYIGGRNFSDTNQWSWVDRTPIDINSKYWRKSVQGHPGGNGAYCLRIHTPSMEWRDTPCDNNQKSICEIVV